MKGSRYGVIGLGQFGMAIATSLAQKGAEVLAIDNNEDHVNEIKDSVAYAVNLDSTNKKALMSQGLEDMDAVVVTIGENFEALLLTVAHLLDMGIKRIIARANGNQQKIILEKIGINEILLPEEEVAKVVVERLINPNVLAFLALPDDYEIVEIRAPKSVIGKELENVRLRDKYKINLVTIKREYEEKHHGKVEFEEHVLGVPSSQTIIKEKDTLVVFGRNGDIERFMDINS